MKLYARGKSAADYQQLYPIPQSEIDRNSNLTQNPGY
ncbi:RagB/SusD family nutrient uptake outer membrane protein [Sphingobacterium sp. ML3W]